MAISVSTSDLGVGMRLWRFHANLTLRQLTDAVNKQLPQPLRVSREILRHYEMNQFGHAGPNPVVMSAIAVACDQPITGLPKEVRDGIEQVRKLTTKAQGKL